MEEEKAYGHAVTIIIKNNRNDQLYRSILLIIAPLTWVEQNVIILLYQDRRGRQKLIDRALSHALSTV